MPGEALSSSVCQFIWKHLSSIEQLEILLLVASKPGVEWTAPAVYQTLLTTMTSIDHRLGIFADAGFFEKISTEPPSYRFAPTGEMAALIAELARAYAEMPVRVISTIYQDRNIVQEFADAFKLKREP